MKYYPLKMEDPTTSESFPEKENKIEVTLSDNNNDYNNNNQSIPKFEDIVDIKLYPKKISNLNQIKSKKKKFEKEPNLKFCCKKIGHTLCLFSDKYGNFLIMIGLQMNLKNSNQSISNHGESIYIKSILISLIILCSS